MSKCQNDQSEAMSGGRRWQLAIQQWGYMKVLLCALGFLRGFYGHLRI